MSAVTPLTPEVPVARVPRTVRELVEYLSLTAEPHWMYHCMQGQPRAYMEIWPSDDDTKPPVRGRYVVLAWWAPGHKEDCEAALVAAMWDVFVAARDEFSAKHNDHPLLFWRRMPAIEEDRRIEGFDGNGSPVGGGWYTRLTCRVWIPGVDLTALNRECKDPIDVGT